MNFGDMKCHHGKLSSWIIWAALCENLSEHPQNVRIQTILCMRKVSPGLRKVSLGPLLSIHTICTAVVFNDFVSGHLRSD